VELAHYKRLPDIAGDLDTGMIGYVHRQTGEPISFLDTTQFPDMMHWQTDVDRVTNSPADYVAIKPMSNRASFQVMGTLRILYPATL